MSEYVYATAGKPVMDERGEISLPRERIIRCADCEYYEPNTYSHFTCELLTYYVEPDGFCKWAERNVD